VIGWQEIEIYDNRNIINSFNIPLFKLSDGMISMKIWLKYKRCN